ncbi:MAG: extracellular solute-binding protein [Prochloraceae cyanobacterium]|nr:extracellular solute-binding protein [Prochloraceae cyanobacterium]
MSSRRSFLISSVALALTQVISGCRSPDAALKIIFLQGSIPLQLIKEFSLRLDRSNSVRFQTKAKLKELFALLEKSADRTDLRQASNNWLPWQKQNQTIDLDLISIGDYWLESAIKKNLIQPLKLEQLEGWKNLPSSCQKLVKRNFNGQLDRDGSIWAAPYRWGTMVIIYNAERFEKLGWTPTDWEDLWREELRDRISLLNQPRQVIGLTLKKLGYSFNTLNLKAIPELKSELLKLQKQVKLYDSTNYLQPLIVEDTWLAVGWYGDVFPLLKTFPKIKAIIPKSGTSLYADLWVKSAFSRANEQDSLLLKWIDFCWQIQQANEISILTDAISPIVHTADPSQLIKDIRNNPLLLPNKSIIDRSEFILTLSKEIEQQYLDVWQAMRRAK